MTKPNVAQRRVITLKIHFVVTRMSCRKNLVILPSVAETIITIQQLIIAAIVMSIEKKLAVLCSAAGEEVMISKSTFAAKGECGRKYPRKITSVVAINDTTPTVQPQEVENYFVVQTNYTIAPDFAVGEK